MKKRPWLIARLQYRFDNFMSGGGLSIFLALLSLFAAAFLLMAVIRFVANLMLPDETVGSLTDQLWRVFLQISDAGAVAEDGDSSVVNKVMGIITIFLGLVLFSSLVAFITSQFEAKLDDLRKGRSLVVEKGHTLILGFGDRVLEIVRELIVANESERDAAIVVLSAEEKDAMDDFFREQIEDTKSTRIITRSGVSSSVQTLERLSVIDAKSIIILNDVAADAEHDDKELADARVLKTIMAIIACTGEANVPPILAEFHLENKRKLARGIAPQISVIEEQSLLAKLMVQTSRVPGLAFVYDNLVGFEGCEFYYYKNPRGWGGKTYGDLVFHFASSSVIGYRKPDGEVVANPPASTVIGDSWELLLIAEDDSDIRYLDAAIKATTPTEPGHAAPPRRIERQLIVGWSRKSAIIVDEYSDYLASGSEIVVVVPRMSDEMRAEFEEIRGRHEGIQMKLQEMDLHDPAAMHSLTPELYDNVILLKEDGGDPELRDAATIAMLLEFRHYFKNSGNKNVRTQLISEVADSNNIEVIQEVGVRDFLISNKFVSKIYAQASEEAEVLKAYDELFGAEGSEIYIKPLSLYLSSIPSRISFGDLCAAALKRGESCFGVRISAEEHNGNGSHGIYINPPKSRIFELTSADFLITLAEEME